ncbi:MAG TPA: dioxygenase, partial [Xanthobacteraceae bacterium]|nr:dioxygenase [Xanthobacteraceae bacterium]
MPYVTEQNLTDVVLERWKAIPDPRLRQVMQSFIEHVHAFVRDIEPTEAEWATAIDFLTRIGQKCDDKRQEFILFSDVMGVSMLVDTLNHRLESGATPTTVEGPFHVPNAPAFADGGNMAAACPGIPCFITGTVKGLDGKPVAHARLDLWQTDGEGLYEAQRDVTEPWMRGAFHSKADGSYTIRTVAPIGYSIPMDGPIGDLVKQTDVSEMRPAHIHFCIEAPGYHRVVTHLFQRGCPYLETDVVYGVKAPLIVDFVENPPGTAPTGEKIGTKFYTIKYDFVLQPAAQAAAAA